MSYRGLCHNLKETYTHHMMNARRFYIPGNSSISINVCLVAAVMLAINTFAISLISYHLRCRQHADHHVVPGGEYSLQFIQDPSLRAYLGRRRVAVYRIIPAKPEKAWEQKYFDVYDISTEDVSKEAQFYMDAFLALKAGDNDTDDAEDVESQGGGKLPGGTFSDAYNRANFSIGNLVTRRGGEWSQKQKEHLFFNVDFEAKNGKATPGAAPQFLPNLKNPCWKSTWPLDTNQENIDRDNPYFKNNTQLRAERYEVNKGKSRLRCLPHFYILGAPHSGIDDMFNQLAKHQDIVPPSIPNPNYWKQGRLTRIKELKRTFRNYVDLFDDLGVQIQNNRKSSFQKITMEAAQEYASDTINIASIPGNRLTKNSTNVQIRNGEPNYVIAHTLQAINPNAKYIVMLRNPVLRFYEQYRSEYPETNRTFLHREISYTVHGYSQFLGTRTLRSIFYKQNLGPVGKVLASGMYHVYLSDWLKVIPREQFLFIKSEEFYEDRPAVMKEVERFLKLDHSEALMDSVNRTSETDDNSKAAREEKMLPRTKELLNRYTSITTEPMRK